MTLEILLNKLEAAGFPVAFREHLQEQVPEGPYITYTVSNDTPFFADGIVFYTQQTVTLLLCCDVKDLDAEVRLRQALADIGYTWTETWNQNENRYEYTVVTTTGKE